MRRFTGTSRKGDNSGHDFVMGVYPMLLDESRHPLAVDFDRNSWQDDARLHRNLRATRVASRSRTVPLGKRGARLVLLPGGRPGSHRPPTGVLPPDRDDGTAS